MKKKDWRPTATATSRGTGGDELDDGAELVAFGFCVLLFVICEWGSLFSDVFCVWVLGFQFFF